MRTMYEIMRTARDDNMSLARQFKKHAISMGQYTDAAKALIRLRIKSARNANSVLIVLRQNNIGSASRRT